MNRILYAEDEPFLGKIVKESLESRGFELSMCTDGDEVMERFKTFHPDICVLDIMLPNRDGYQLAEAIRKLKPQIPIIFLTAKTQTEDVLLGFQVGANDYIRKPFSMEELIVRIKNLMALTQNKALGSATNGAQLGNYRFYANRFELHFKDTVRKLSHRETELLSILVENQNQTVSRKDILMRVWNDDSFYNSRNLDVYITRLRDMLQQDDQLEILTLKGIGYHFKCS